VWPGKRLKHPTENIGVEVWPNVSTTRNDLSLKSNKTVVLSVIFCVYLTSLFDLGPVAPTNFKYILS